MDMLDSEMVVSAENLKTKGRNLDTHANCVANSYLGMIARVLF